MNQAYLLVDRPDFGKTSVKGGRQRIVLDDQRFIGNVGWRQNEQTYDGVWAQSGRSPKRLTLGYGYIADVRRIFGNEGPRSTRDYDSNSHLARVAYDVAPWFQPVGFAYLLDLRDAPVESSNTFGLRATGTAPFAEDWSVIYQATYAYQTDGGTSGGTNPVNYHAHYALGDLALGFRPLGAIGAGYELLGSDDGRARVVTPLATAHKFTGWADDRRRRPGGYPGRLRVRLARAALEGDRAGDLPPVLESRARPRLRPRARRGALAQVRRVLDGAREGRLVRGRRHRLAARHHAPVARGDRGVLRGVDRASRRERSAPTSRLRREQRRLGLGTPRTTASRVTMSPEQANILIAGSSGSGKSTLATALLEQLMSRGYQCCFASIRKATTASSPRRSCSAARSRPPEMSAIASALEQPAANLVVDLLGVQLADRPDFAAGLLLKLQEMRARLGARTGSSSTKRITCCQSDWHPAPRDPRPRACTR